MENAEQKRIRGMKIFMLKLTLLGILGTETTHGHDMNTTTLQILKIPEHDGMTVCINIIHIKT